MDLDHVALNTIDIEGTANWYVKNFNAKITYMDETWAFMELGNTRLALTLPSQHPPHIAFTVESIEDVPGDPITHRDGSVSSYIKDPAGNNIEYVYWPTE
ncbi:MAG: hypothetical protein CBB97_07180 [Candidatus Endolissoclinum sp. TMED37]|nr:MAG: hypothetical protein CBB97_07180 [Candidatus Endolissoclinum sp. TMED37]|tara:strand:+ start:1260 stop:1559 length:300 start_codon:yes stop_codon:yes gene_type:complete